MGATQDFNKPDKDNPIDSDLDQIRSNLNFILMTVAAGSIVLPGWDTEVVSASGDYSQPDQYKLTKGTIEIHINLTWSSDAVASIQLCWDDGVSSPGLSCYDAISFDYDEDGNYIGPPEITLFHDTFTDTDTTPLGSHTPDTGTGWTETIAGSDPQISSNKLVSQGTTEWVCDATAADCVITGTMRNYAGTTQQAGIQFRNLSDSDGTENRWLLWSNATQYLLNRNIGGSGSTIDTYNWGVITGADRAFVVTLSGDSIIITVDDIEIFNVTDSTHNTGLYHGFRFYTTTARIDDFKVVT